MVGGLEGTHGCAEDFGDFGVFHIVEIAHIEYKTLLFGQLGYCLLELHLEFVGIEIWVCLGVGEEIKVGVGVVDIAVLLALGGKEIEAFVDGDFI